MHSLQFNGIEIAKAYRRNLKLSRLADFFLDFFQFHFSLFLNVFFRFSLFFQTFFPDFSPFFTIFSLFSDFSPFFTFSFSISVLMQVLFLVPFFYIKHAKNHHAIFHSQITFFIKL